MAALVMAGCGTRSTQSTDPQPVRTTTTATIPQGHPQAVEPVAGDPGPSTKKRKRNSSTANQSTSSIPPGPPTMAATDTKAPAAGAPTDAQVKAAIAQFQLAVAKYHLDRLNLSGALLNPSQLPPGQYNVSIASVFTDYGLPVACGGVEHVAELGVANKTLPCGTEVIFVYGNRAVRVPVIDRGPYIAGRTWDLTGATAEALHFPGLGPIKWRLG
jgi:rare lipoprotein A (peptidoglycan hydrolase)